MLKQAHLHGETYKAVVKLLRKAAAAGDARRQTQDV